MCIPFLFILLASKMHLYLISKHTFSGFSTLHSGFLSHLLKSKLVTLVLNSFKRVISLQAIWNFLAHVFSVKVLLAQHTEKEWKLLKMTSKVFNWILNSLTWYNAVLAIISFHVCKMTIFITKQSSPKYSCN